MRTLYLSLHISSTVPSLLILHPLTTSHQERALHPRFPRRRLCPRHRQHGHPQSLRALSEMLLGHWVRLRSSRSTSRLSQHPRAPTPRRRRSNNRPHRTPRCAQDQLHRQHGRGPHHRSYSRPSLETLSDGTGRQSKRDRLRGCGLAESGGAMCFGGLHPRESGRPSHRLCIP